MRCQVFYRGVLVVSFATALSGCCSSAGGGAAGAAVEEGRPAEVGTELDAGGASGDSAAASKELLFDGGSGPRGAAAPGEELEEGAGRGQLDAGKGAEVNADVRAEAEAEAEAETEAEAEAEAETETEAGRRRGDAGPSHNSGSRTVASYVARLGRLDHLNLRGEPLKSAALIVVQDRTNHHAGRRDAQDRGDPVFHTRKARVELLALIEEYLSGRPSLALRIVKSHPVVHILVVEASDGRRRARVELIRP